MNLLQEIEDEEVEFSEREANTILGKIKTRKAIGPDGLCSKVLKECRLQLTPISLNLYKESMDSDYIPLIWGTAKLLYLSPNQVSSLQSMI